MANLTAVKVSIIVPAFNEEKILHATLTQIKSATHAFIDLGWETELIVCDNNSTDRTAEIAQAAGAKVVFEPVNQIARARNTGAAAARGDWLIFVDADSHPGAELFADTMKEIQSGTCLAGSATIRWDKKHFSTELWMPLVNAGFRWRRMFSGAFIFVERTAFQKLRGFNPETYAGEDVELSGRLKKMACETGKRLVILHQHPILTSARRFVDYSALTPIRVLFHIIFKPHAFTTSPEAARRWYDARR